MIHKILMTVALLIFGTTLAYTQEMITDGGVITAEGDGTIALNGGGEVIIEGIGTLFIVDRSDETIIDIDSRKKVHHKEQQTRGNTVHTYRRFDGMATVIGDDIAIVMEGVNITVSVSGTGSMFVQGEGNYMVNNDDPQQWSEVGTLIVIGENRE
jgi:hypothetical protein